MAAETTAASSPRPAYKWRALVVGGTYIGGATIERASWPLLLPTVRDHYGIATSEVAWVMVMFALGMAGSTLTVGHLGDKLGHRRLASIGLVCEGCLVVAAALMPVFWPILLLRLFQGVAAATALNNSQAYTVGAWPSEERGRALGFLSAMPSVGLMIGPLYAGLMAEHIGWRWALIGSSVPVFTCATLTRLVIKEDVLQAEPARDVLRRLDWAGALALLASIVSLILGARFASSDDLRPITPAFFVAAALGLFAVVRLERRSENPVLNLGLFTKRTFAIAASSMVLFSIIAGATALLWPFYLQRGLGWSVAYYGAVFIAASSVQPFGSPLGGLLSDKIGPRPVQLAGVAIILSGLFVASLLGSGPQTWQVIAALLLVSLGGSLFGPANNRVIYGEVPRTSLGTASAISASGRYVGQSIGAALAAALLTAAGESDITGAFGSSMLILVGLLLGGMTVIWTAGRLGPLLSRGRQRVAVGAEGPRSG